MPTSDDRDLRRRRREAADKTARAARSNAAAFSKRIPGATKVREYRAYTEVVTLGNEAPNAAPFEAGEEHPLFGDRKHEYRQPHRPFMQAAFDRTADDGANHMGDVVDDWGEEFGFNDK